MQQCWDTFPKYGDESLTTKIKTFTIGLEDYNTPEITEAFRHWIKERTKFPMPAEIGSIIQSNQRHAREMLSFNGNCAKPRIAQERESVPWAGKMWSEMSTDLRQQCITHIGRLSLNKDVETALGYIQYLQHHAKAPNNLKQTVFV